MDKVASILLLRSGVVTPPVGRGSSRERFVRELEVEAAALGWTFSPALREAIARIPRRMAVSWGDWLLGTMYAEVGGDLAWVPLFRRFPHSTPSDTDRLYVERMLAAQFQDDGPRCILCSSADTVRPVSPCGHLVCRVCFSPAEYSACPICHRRLDPMDPFLVLPEPNERNEPSGSSAPSSGLPRRFRRIDLGHDVTTDAGALRDVLASRPSPLSQDERADLVVLVHATAPPGDLGWLGEVPARETKAVLVADALATAPPERLRDTAAQAADRWDTATDIARTVWTLSGGDPNLHVSRPAERRGRALEGLRPSHEPRQRVAVPRVVPLRRGLRAAMLERLDTMPMPTVIEDILRHPTVWKRIAERLHPFEYAVRYPRASAAFSVLRNSRHRRDSAPGAALLAAESEGWVRLITDGDLIGARALTLRVKVEKALDDGDGPAALALLDDRPGDLLRRLDHLARGWTGDPAPLVDAAHRAGLTASPRVTYAVLASLTDRDRPPRRSASPLEPAAEQQHRRGASSEPDDAPVLPPADGAPGTPAETRDDAPATRVFFPRGGAAFTWSATDARPLLAPDLPELLRSSLRAALEARARSMSPFDVAVVDTRLRDIPIPAGTQSTSGSSGSLPRGSRVSFPTDVPTLRLFLHWVDPPGVRVDLDLSVVLFDEHGSRMDHCDYTRLRSGLGAVHSGDLTSAPGPLGATEFLDLDLDALRANGVVWAVPIVFSYNDVPFDNLDEAIAGVGVPFPGQHFDPAGVLVRYDLRGDSRVSLPFVANLVDGTMRWFDLHLPSEGYAHSVDTRGDRLARTVFDLESVYAGRSRADSFTLALTHARARAARVVLLDGERFTDLDGMPTSAPDLDDSVALVVCLDEPPDLGQVAPGSLVVRVRGEGHAHGGLDELLS